MRITNAKPENMTTIQGKSPTYIPYRYKGLHTDDPYHFHRTKPHRDNISTPSSIAHFTHDLRNEKGETTGWRDLSKKSVEL